MNMIRLVLQTNVEILFLLTTVILTFNHKVDAQFINVCSESESESEIPRWTDFAITFNVSYGSSLHELNCSSIEDKEIHTLSYNLSSEDSNPITGEGYLVIDSKQYESEEYCIENISENEIKFQLCQKQIWKSECGSEVACIRKCCQPHEVFIAEKDGSFSCIKSTIWKPTIFENENDKVSQNFDKFSKSIQFVSSHPREGWCEEFGPIVLDSTEFEGTKYVIKILSDGNVIVKNHQLQPWRVLQPGTFCIEGILRNGSETLDSENDLVVVDCSAPDEEEQVDQPVYIVFQVIACCFLILTVFVYFVLWDKQNIHSWTLLSYAICMLFLHISIFATYWHNDTVYAGESDWSCRCLAIISHFLYLSTFCWLTLINFDVWWTFGGQMSLTIGRSRRKRRFLCYLLFATFTPTAVLLLGFLLKRLHDGSSGSLLANVIYLDYSTIHCYISDYSSFYFKFLPVAILLGCNIILFIKTVITLHRIGESTKFATNKSSQSDSEKSKFLLFVKLFFVMGLIWILELVSYFVFGRGSTNRVAYILDIINILQPVAIFVIFVCKADVFRGLQLKLPCLRRLFQLLGLQYLRSRIGSGLSGLSSTSVTTQMSTCSTRSNGSSAGIGNPGNHVSFEMLGESVNAS